MAIGVLEEPELNVTKFPKVNLIPVAIGTEVEVVGFGATVPFENTGLGTKRLGTNKVAETSINDRATGANYPDNIVLAADSGAITSGGDSGGPLLTKYGKEIIGVCSGSLPNDPIISLFTAINGKNALATLRAAAEEGHDIESILVHNAGATDLGFFDGEAPDENQDENDEDSSESNDDC